MKNKEIIVTITPWPGYTLLVLLGTLLALIFILGRKIKRSQNDDN